MHHDLALYGSLDVWHRDSCRPQNIASDGVRIPPREGASRRGVGFPIVKYRRSAPSRVLFDGKFHQAVAGWTVNRSGFIQICLNTMYIFYAYTAYAAMEALCLEACPSRVPSCLQSRARYILLRNSTEQISVKSYHEINKLNDPFLAKFELK